MLNCPWKVGSILASPDGDLLPIFAVVPLFHATKESATPSKVKFHSKRNSGDLPSKTWTVVRTETSETLSGPRCGEGRVHVMVASTAQKKWPVNTAYSGARLSVWTLQYLYVTIKHKQPFAKRDEFKIDINNVLNYSCNCTFIICKKIVNNKIILMKFSINTIYLFSTEQIKPIYSMCDYEDNCYS